jgi:hypothetical protein
MALARSIIRIQHNGADAERTPAPPLCLYAYSAETRGLAELTYR